MFQRFAFSSVERFKKYAPYALIRDVMREKIVKDMRYMVYRITVSHVWPMSFAEKEESHLGFNNNIEN